MLFEFHLIELVPLCVSSFAGRLCSLLGFLFILYYKMDKKSIVNDLLSYITYISFRSWLLSARQRDTAQGYSKHSKIRPGRHKETGCHCSCVRDDERVYYQITSTSKKIASVAMLIGGALANALAFTGSSYLFYRLSADVERQRHDAAIGKRQKTQIEWVHK